MNTNSPRAARLRTTRLWATAGSALLLAACAAPPLAVPTALQPADNQRFVHTLAAEGVQIYECRLRTDGAGTEWAFVAPRADLFLLNGRRIGQHGAGPYWETLDGSRVTAKVAGRAEAPRAGAIPWLLLEADGAKHGFLAGVTSIQRLNTEGGVAPAGGCDAAAVGKRTEVDYRADYRFFRTQP